MLKTNFILKRLIAREDLIAFSCRESFTPFRPINGTRVFQPVEHFWSQKLLTESQTEIESFKERTNFAFVWHVHKMIY
jgi:hypothetical protein